jgi:hypothetical protein
LTGCPPLTTEYWEAGRIPQYAGILSGYFCAGGRKEAVSAIADKNLTA